MNIKPVTFVSTSYRPHSQGNSAEPTFFQRALKITQDPEQIKQMIGVKAVADVFNTLDNLDKMSIRKEYNQALSDCGIDFKFIVKGIKKECKHADKSVDKLKAYQMLLKSMGMDSYDDKKVDGGGGWEDALQKLVKGKESSKKTQVIVGDVEEEGSIEDNAIEYEVKLPTMPDSVKKRKLLELEEGKSLYE
jgi:hypothetical protein